MTRSRCAPIVVAVLALAACGEAETEPRQPAAPPPVEVSEHGLTVSLPPGWRAATESLTPHLVDPREQLAVATFPLRYRQTECAHVPGSALEDLGPDDAFVTLEERGLDPGSTWVGFPARPTRFGPSLGGPSGGRRLHAERGLHRPLVHLHRRRPPLPRPGRLRPADVG